MQIPADTMVDVLVVDNDANGSAREIVTQLAATSPLPLRYGIEPTQGRGFARNRVLDMATEADYIGFIDDDITVDPSWLEHLYNFIRDKKAHLVVSGIDYQIPAHAPNWAYRCRLFVPNIPPPDKPLKSVKTGNLLIDARWIRQQGLRFPNHLHHEDAIFSTDAYKRGGLLLSDTRITAATPVEPERLYLSWLWQRCFNNGMNRASMTKRDYPYPQAVLVCFAYAMRLTYFAAGALALSAIGRRHWVHAFEHIAMAAGWIAGAFTDSAAIVPKCAKSD